jgi:hypothetical protein
MKRSSLFCGKFDKQKIKKLSNEWNSYDIKQNVEYHKYVRLNKKDV